MGISLLQFIIIISVFVFLLFGIDLYKRRKMNILHFIVFLGGSALLTIFALDTEILNKFGKVFGIARGADLLVYISLIFLAYFYINLLNSFTKDKYNLTRLVSRHSILETYQKEKENIKNFKNKNFKDEFVFNIRVYNEGSKVGGVIDEIISAGFHKLVFIDDGSQDNTLEILEKKKKEYPACLFIILSHTINRGGGAANQTGYNFIKKYGDELKIKRFVGFDSDGQMSINDMESFIDRIKNEEYRVNRLIEKNMDVTYYKNKENDLYIGSRFINGGKAKNIPKTRKLILFISKIVTRLFYGTNVSDPHNGYRVISLQALRKIHLTSDGMHYANELNEQIIRNKMKYEEVPVNIRYTEYSLGKGQKNSNSLRLATEMIYKKIFFR